MSVRTATASGAVAALLGACVLLPATQAQASGAHDSPVVYAHRGASAYAPENTLAAVDAADDLGIDWWRTTSSSPRTVCWSSCTTPP